MAYAPASQRYDQMTYRRSGRSGLLLPAVSLGLWHNFGLTADHARARGIIRTAFDLGITHFDLANDYGPPPGSAEELFGGVMRSDFQAHRHEIVVSTKAGYRMWPGPYGEWGGRKYLLASLDQSLGRLGLDHVDIFYSHRFDPDTPLDETMAALETAVRQGKALYVGVSSYSARRTREAAMILRRLGTPAVIHQPSYSMLNRWIEEDGLLDRLEAEGMGCIAFSPLAQGLLTDKYLDGIPEDSRAASGSPAWRPNFLDAANVAAIRALNDVAQARGQTLAQMAIAWVLRDRRVTSALVGASRPEQVRDAVAALANVGFTAEELAEIDRHATEAGVNIWLQSSSA